MTRFGFIREKVLQSLYQAEMRLSFFLLQTVWQDRFLLV